MSDKEKYARAISKILKDTLDDRLIWKVTSKDKLNKIEKTELLSQVYETDLEEKILRVYKYKAKNSWTVLGEDWYTQQSVLEMVDTEGTAYWTFPVSGGVLEDLISTINRKINGVDEFINKLVNEGP